MSDRVVMIIIPRAADDVLDFSSILNTLPLGSRIVDIRDAVSTGYNGVGIVIENSRFEEHPQGHQLKVIYPKQDFGGVYYIDKDDLPMEKSGNVSIPKTQSRTNKSYSNSTSIDDDDWDTFVKDKTQPRYMGFDKDPVCTHNWVNYQGIIENYKYCSKCDKKKDK